MTTMKDVAKEAGVSIATVSRVINDQTLVSTELRERVQAAMSKLDYHPSNVARSLRRQQTQTVAVVVPQLDQPFFSTLTFAIQQRLFIEDYYTFTCSTMESEAEEAAYIEMLLGQRVDGVIVAPTGRSAQNIHRLISGNIPVILVDRQVPGITDIDHVLFDNKQGGQVGMQHLLDLGHRHIAIIGAPAHSGAIRRRIEGAQAAARQRPDVQLHVQVVDREKIQQFDIGYQIAHDLLRQANRPTAVFALTDTAAVGAMHAANEIGLRIPEDVSIVGFDNIPMAKYSLPALTTVAQPIHDMGAQTADILLKRLVDRHTEPVHIVSKAQLIVRKSTHAPGG